jgi:hypothetical protein
MGPRVWGTEQLLVHIKKKLTLKKIIGQPVQLLVLFLIWVYF